MSLAGFEPAIPESEGPQIRALDTSAIIFFTAVKITEIHRLIVF